MVAAAGILAHELSTYGDGDALWSPEPKDDQEIEIGDVGFIDNEGSFTRLFNITRPENDLLNGHGVPPDFHPLDLNKRLFKTMRPHRGAMPITSRSVTYSQKRAHLGANAGSFGGGEISLKFSCSGASGAFINLQDVTTKTYLSSAGVLTDYMLANHDRWYQYTSQGKWGLKPEQIILVQAYVKTSVWSVAAYRSGVRQSRSASLTGKIGPIGEAAFEIETSTRSGYLFDTRYGPMHRDQLQLPTVAPPSPSPSGKGKERAEDLEMYDLQNMSKAAVIPATGLPHDQCIFLSYYKIKRRMWGGRKISAKAEDQDFSEDGEGEAEVVANDENVLAQEPMPLDLLLDHILEHSDAEVAIACHSDVADLFDGGLWPADFATWLKQYRPEITVNDNKAGYLVHDEKIIEAREMAIQAAIAKQDQEEEARKAEQAAILDSLNSSLGEPSTAVSSGEVQEQPPAETQPVPPAAPALPPATLVEQPSAFDQLPITESAPSPPQNRSEGPAFEEKTDEDIAAALSQQFDGQNGLRLQQDGKITVGRRTWNNTLRYPHVSMMDNTVEGNAAITSLAISPRPVNDRYHIATTSENSSVQVWDLETGALTMKFEGHRGVSWWSDFSPDGTKLVSGGADHIGIVWDLETLTQVAELTGHTGDVWQCAYSPDGKWIATGSSDTQAKLWNGQTGGLVHAELPHNFVVMTLRFSPDSQRLVTCADSIGFIWNVADGAMVAQMNGHTGMIWNVAFSSDHIRVITSAEDGTARIWSLEDGAELVTIREHNGPVWSAQFSPDGNEVVTGGHDGCISICDSFTGERHHLFEDGTSVLTSVTYSSDGDFVAASCVNGNAKLYDARAGTLIAEFQGHTDKVKSVLFTPDNNKLVTASDDGTVRVWDVLDALRL